MATMGDMRITFEFEPLVKLVCLSTGCRHNRQGTCNLKMLRLDEMGVCESRVPRVPRVATRGEVAE